MKFYTYIADETTRMVNAMSEAARNGNLEKAEAIARQVQARKMLENLGLNDKTFNNFFGESLNLADGILEGRRG